MWMVSSRGSAKLPAVKIFVRPVWPLGGDCGLDKIVITGAAGFIGSHLADLFVARYPEARFVFFDKMTYSADIENVVHHLHDRRRQLLVGDICDPEFCRQATAGADLVIHAAAESHVDRSFMNATRFVHTNVFGTHTLLE